MKYKLIYEIIAESEEQRDQLIAELRDIIGEPARIEQIKE